MAAAGVAPRIRLPKGRQWDWSSWIYLKVLAIRMDKPLLTWASDIEPITSASSALPRIKGLLWGGFMMTSSSKTTMGRDGSSPSQTIPG